MFQRFYKEAQALKQSGNELFKSSNYREAALEYTQALRLCPLAYKKERAIYYSNRAASKMKLVSERNIPLVCYRLL